MTTWAEAAEQMIEVVGRLAALQGELADWSTGTANGGPDNDGFYPFTQPDGTVFRLPCIARIQADGNDTGPEAFGAIGDGESHPARDFFPTLEACQAVYPFAKSLAQEMDWLGWQKMVKRLGIYKLPFGSKYRMCNADPGSHETLEWVCGIAEVEGSYDFLDWRSFRAKYSDQHMMPNYDFATTDGWRNSTLYPPDKHIDAVFGGGAAVCTDIYDGTVYPEGTNPYYEFEHSIDLPAGRYRLTVEGEVTRGVSFNHKNLNPPSWFVSFSGGISGRFVNSPIAFDLDDPEGTPTPIGGVLDFQSTGNVGSVVFKGSGYINFRITKIDVVPWIANAAIHFTRDGALAQYFLHRRLKRVTLYGPMEPELRQGLTGILWKSFENLDGNQHDLEDVEARYWWRGFSYGDAAYLINYYNCNLANNDTAVHFPGPLFNAGENIKFIAGSVSGNTVAFDNPGTAEFTLLGTICDYNKQVCINNSGVIRLIGTRHEQHTPERVDQPIWHCTTGRVVYSACRILIAGGIGTAPVPPAKLDTSLASIEISQSEIYNLSSASGVVAVGPGRVNITGMLNNGNPNIGPDLISAAPVADVLGGGGMFELPDINEFTMEPISLEGGISATGENTVIADRWTSNVIKAEVTTDYHFTGTRSLRITKLTNPDNTIECRMQILVPLAASGNLLGKMHFLFPNDLDLSYADAEETPPIYFRQFYVQQLGQDQFGRPRLGRQNVFKGEDTLHLPLIGSSTWQKRSISTFYHTPDASDRFSPSERSPAWATHLMIQLDMQNMPAGSFYLDGLQANFIG